MRHLDRDTTLKLVIRKAPLDSGGYTKDGGVYFGTPNNLWEVSSDEAEYGGEEYIRASDKAGAIRKAKLMFPRAKWGKKGMQKLVDDAAARLAKTIRIIMEIEADIAKGERVTPGQLEFLKKRIPIEEAALVDAQRACRGERKFGI